MKNFVAYGIAGLVLAASLCLGFVDTSRAQIIVAGDGGAGGVMTMTSGSGVMSLLFQMTRDEQWQDAKQKLIERANKGEAVPVVYHAQQIRAHQGERVAARIDALLSSLEEAGHYPLTQATVDGQVAHLQELLTTIEGKNPSDKVLSEVAMALHRAAEELQSSETMIKTGKLPEKQGRRAIGRVIGGDN